MSERTKLVKKLDIVFSKYIRQRDMKDGFGKCCSCGKLITVGDAGHFVNRKWLPTRWREDNVHLQCLACNRFDEGNSAGYSLFMIRKYGEKHVEYLSLLKNERAGFSLGDLKLMIEDYKQKLSSP